MPQGWPRQLSVSTFQIRMGYRYPHTENRDDIQSVNAFLPHMLATVLLRLDWPVGSGIKLTSVLFIARPTESGVMIHLRPARKQAKAERTRARLMKAARRVLGERGYQAARVTDITAEAGMSQGTFYLYFDNKHDITMEVMRELIEKGQATMLAARSGDDAFDQILAPTRAYVALLYQEAPLVRALLQAADEDADLARFWQETNHAWLTRVARAIDRRCARGAVDEQTRMFTAYAMNWMVDGLLHSLLARRDPYLEAIVPPPDHVAEALSVLHYRAVYARNPDRRKLTYAHAMLNMRLPEGEEA